MTSELERVCRSVIELYDKAERHKTNPTYSELLDYELYASNNAYKLARACLVMLETLEYYSDDDILEPNVVRNQAFRAIVKAEEIMKGKG